MNDFDISSVFSTFSGDDGVMSKRELARALRSLGYYPSRRDLTTLFRGFDEDGSGDIGFEEFRDMINTFNSEIDETEDGPAAAEVPAAPLLEVSASEHVEMEPRIHKALFIGINYVGTKSALRGCVNDVRSMNNLITKALHCPIDEARFYVDEAGFPNSAGLPTRDNIIEGLRWLVSGVKPGQSLFFHYSGHGTSVQSKTGGEEDGMDEAICPVDYQRAGILVDDDIYRLLVEPLPKGVRLTAVFDCCHSGTIMDLPYTFTASAAAVNNAASRGAVQAERNSEAKGSKGFVVMFSGCQDNQTSADAYQAGQFGGALTFSMSAVLSSSKVQPTLVNLLDEMLKALRGHYTQVPMLSSSHPISSTGTFHFIGA